MNTSLDLLQYNTFLEEKNIAQFPGNSITVLWLWDTNPNEDLHPDTSLNTNHLLGLLYCRKMYFSNQETFATTHIPLHSNLKIFEIAPGCMNLQQLMDSLLNICVQWPSFLQKYPDLKKSVFCYVDQCAYRFGFFVSHALEGSMLNMEHHTEQYKANLRILTKNGVRRFLSIFLALYRNFYLSLKCTLVPGTFFNCEIRRPHMEASMEEFDLICMHNTLPVGAKLLYKNDFRGMYNHVSQVVFYHNQKYDRINRVEWNMLESSTDAIHILPALRQLHPEVNLLYEEDDFTENKQWVWILVPGRVYLMDPQKNIFYSPDVTVLYQKYVTETVKSTPTKTDKMTPFSAFTT